MFLLNIVIHNISMPWKSMEQFVNRYQSLFLSQCMDNIGFCTGFENKLGIEYEYAEGRGSKIVVDIKYNGTKSRLTTFPSVSQGSINFPESKTVTQINGNKIGIPNNDPDFEAIAIEHTRAYLIVLNQLENTKLTGMLDKFLMRQSPERYN